MPIQTTHPAYDENIDKWNRCRDVYAGDDAIKSRGEKYLPKIDPTQTGAEYSSYATRATFFEAVGRTIDGFIGAISRRPHKIDLPTRLEPMLDDITTTGLAMSEFVKKLCLETLMIGRCGILVDYDETGQRPYLSAYNAESITNWSADRIVLSETVFEQDADDPYKLVAVAQLRELSLIDGVYTVTLWRKSKASVAFGAVEWEVFEATTPTRRGKALDAIPFVWVSIVGPTAEICKPPLLGMVNVALSHYRLSADYAHGLHWTGLPTFYVTGGDTDEPYRLGSASAIILKDAQAKVGYAEFTGQGLGSLERALAAKEKQLAALGASVLAAEGRQIETATAASIRHGGETSILSATVSAVQASLKAALSFAAKWASISGDVSVELNDDFLSARLGGQELIGLLQSYQAGALSLPIFLGALQDGGILPQQMVVAEEVANLKASGAPAG